ncbi:ATP-binding protein [Streptomyces sp. TRM 70361]|uniref:ATP-binding protein n=1 Tax=Streptomyces sp. TRM 70361 TaxID=3116553 RepID=UPI002E7C10BB|nr:ATP-binding protein [Streptomyces sp. TRM 70361]MEE1941653.1 ATP-binding protein [Streptomyces sp. TRM 70361]
MRLRHCLVRKRWELSFPAEPQRVAELRRALRTQLTLWGFPEHVDTAQLCVSELVANVIRHIGTGTPVTLAVSASRRRLRVELTDPGVRALPAFPGESAERESGRGLVLLDALADRWGLVLREDVKVVWCELANAPQDHPAHRPHGEASPHPAPGRARTRRSLRIRLALVLGLTDARTGRLHRPRVRRRTAKSPTH